MTGIGRDELRRAALLALPLWLGVAAAALAQAPCEGIHVTVLNIIRKSQAHCTFEEIPQGRYAIGVIHDENMNGLLDTNMLGVPREGYGFSNDAQGTLGPPPFDAASFPYDGRNLEMTIRLDY